MPLTILGSLVLNQAGDIMKGCLTSGWFHSFNMFVHSGSQRLAITDPLIVINKSIDCVQGGLIKTGTISAIDNMTATIVDLCNELTVSVGADLRYGYFASGTMLYSGSKVWKQAGLYNAGDKIYLTNAACTAQLTGTVTGNRSFLPISGTYRQLNTSRNNYIATATVASGGFIVSGSNFVI